MPLKRGIDHHFHRHHPQREKILRTKKLIESRMLRSIRSFQHGGKLRELNIIESQLNEMHTKIVNIEKTASRWDREVKSLKKKTKKLEKNV